MLHGYGYFCKEYKTNDFYKDISDDVDNRFDTSNYGVKRPLPIGKNKKVIGLICPNKENLMLIHEQFNKLNLLEC